MVKLHSCASLVNAPALCAMEHEVKGESSVNIIAQISAELQREKQKNAELMQRISTLEAQIRERDKVPLVFNGQDGCQNTVENRSKRQKVEKGECEYIRVDSQMKHNSQWMPDTHMYMKDRVVTWMGMEETDFLQCDPAADFEDMDDTDDENGEEDDINGFLANHKNKENTEEATCKKVKEDLLKLEVDREADTQNLASSSRGRGEPTSSAHADKEIHESVIGKRLNPSINPADSSRECNHHQKEETTVTGGGHEYASNTSTPRLEIKRCENMFQQKKPPKIAFCPKEVKRIIQSDELSRKNAQSHTIRKIIVFASLGIRHGCEDMYELDFNHFSILHKGQPYLSPKDPGEHVLYENPGFRRKIFYPNRQNPTLCPVQILEEEKAMRPSDADCPSCLFLCIKYGGRTRNIPQNEYVRQRMGRNKLKSFGPAICRMSMLVHIRSGSFFFKALGITLLFMAGYPDDIVQRETKYRNLDLLQKYYRTDEDAEGEELFLSYPVTSDTNDSLISPRLSMKTISTKSKCKKNTGSTCQGTKDKTSVWPPAPSNSGDSSQFELKGYASVQNQAITTAQSIPSQAPADLFTLANPLMSSTNANFPHSNQSYPMFPPHPNNSFVPMMYWHPSTMFLHYPHPSSHSFMYPIAGNFISVYPQPYHGTPTLIPKPLKDSLKNDVALSENANCESNTSSSSAEPNKDQTS